MIFEISEGLTETILILTNVSDTQIWIKNEYDDAFNDVDIQSKYSDDNTDTRNGGDDEETFNRKDGREYFMVSSGLNGLDLPSVRTRVENMYYKCVIWITGGLLLVTNRVRFSNHFLTHKIPYIIINYINKFYSGRNCQTVYKRYGWNRNESFWTGKRYCRQMISPVNKQYSILINITLRNVRFNSTTFKFVWS